MTHSYCVFYRKQHRAAVLALDFPQPSCLATTSYDKKVREFDLRLPVSLLASHQEHRKPVLALASTENYLYSGGEDKTVCVWDRRTRKILQTVKVCVCILLYTGLMAYLLGILLTSVT